MNILDQTWQPFTNLMLQHIFNVLLVCTDYDRFLIEKDGRIEEQLFYEYTNLGLTSPPKISHAENADQALELLGSRQFEMVIMMLDITRPSMTVLAETVKRKWPDISLIVLSPAPSKNRSNQLKAYTSRNPIDQLFYWQGDPNLFLAMIKLVEDQINLDHDTQAAPIEVILLVEDSVR
ncbi:MAG: pyruvate, phosphate dikinase, partial [Sphaerochaetaceae bacterium]|nr:pyruvate, phosphate dikinase [Sphaerochaetaceae bacterium]